MKSSEVFKLSMSPFKKRKSRPVSHPRVDSIAAGNLVQNRIHFSFVFFVAVEQVDALLRRVLVLLFEFVNHFDGNFRKSVPPVRHPIRVLVKSVHFVIDFARFAVKFELFGITEPKS